MRKRTSENPPVVVHKYYGRGVLKNCRLSGSGHSVAQVEFTNSKKVVRVLLTGQDYWETELTNSETAELGLRLRNPIDDTEEIAWAPLQPTQITLRCSVCQNDFERVLNVPADLHLNGHESFTCAECNRKARARAERGAKAAKQSPQTGLPEESKDMEGSPLPSPLTLGLSSELNDLEQFQPL